MIFDIGCGIVSTTWTTSASTDSTTVTSTPTSSYVTVVASNSTTASTCFPQEQPPYWRPDEETLRRWHIEAATVRRRIRQERRINDVTELVLKAGRRRDMTATEQHTDDEAIRALFVRRPR